MIGWMGWNGGRRRGAQLLGFLLATTSAFGATVFWNPSFSPNVARYDLYYGKLGGPARSVDAGTLNSVTLHDLEPGAAYYFFAKSVDGDGVESPPSEAVFYTVPFPLYLPLPESYLGTGCALSYGELGGATTTRELALDAVFSLDDLTPGKTYVFRLNATNVLGKVPVSTSVSWTYPAGGIQAGTSPTFALFPPSAARVVGFDTTTQGSWKGKYGAVGYIVLGDSAKYPRGVVVSASGKNYKLLQSSSENPAALERANKPEERLEACWFGEKGLRVSMSFPDRTFYRVSVYCADYEGTGIGQTLEVLDADNLAVLASRTMFDFGGGAYVQFDVRGRVILRVKPNATLPTAISGIFFDALPAADAGLIATP